MKNLLLQLLALAVFSLRLAGQVAEAPPSASAAEHSVTSKAETRQAASLPSAPSVCSTCIRTHMEFLASDAMRGRGSGTEDERRAAGYIAKVLREYGIGAPAGGYLQQADVVFRNPTGLAQLKFQMAGGGILTNDFTWTHGKEILVVNMTRPEISGRLQKIDLSKGNPEPGPGSVVFLRPKEGQDSRGDIERVLERGAAVVLIPETPGWRGRWGAKGKQLLHLPGQVEGTHEAGIGGNANIVVVSHDVEHILEDLPDGTAMHLMVPTSAPRNSHTWNVVGVLKGQNSGLQSQAVLLSAHLDHVGIGEPVNGDSIYNGADDDASGVAAVLELARVLGAGGRPRRTVIFALFGSEELGGLGSVYFREHPPVPLAQIIANLEFEMIGRADPAVPSDALWLTGWDRSNLGPELAAHGARLVGDPHPSENFFMRSDNYVLAKKGVVAQTVSSYGLHKDYHRPSDDLAHIDFTHMSAAIGSLLGPVEWLVNSEFVPKWVKAVDSGQ